jgi:multidrug efflux pump subunit AcrB
VDGVSRIDGRADDGLATVEVRFSGDDLGPLRDAVDGVRRNLPQDAEIPTVSRIRGETVWLSVPPEEAERTARELEQTPGIFSVRVHGAPRRRVMVTADSTRLQAYGVDASSVMDALRGCFLDIPAGRIDAIAVRVSGVRSIEGIGDCTVVVRPDGASVRIGDVATIRDDLEPTTVLGPEGRTAVLEVRTDLPSVSGKSLGTPARVGPPNLESLHRQFPEATVLVDGEVARLWGDIELPPPGFDVFAPKGPVTEVVVSGPELEAIDAAVRQIRSEAAKLGATTWTDMPHPTPEYQVEIERDKAASLGVQVDNVLLGMALAGTPVRAATLGEAPVWLEVSPKPELSAILLRGAAGPVPLSEVATIREGLLRSIVHVDRQRAAVIEIDGPVPDLERISLPAGYVAHLR